MKVSMDGKYVTRGGCPVTILTVSMNYHKPVALTIHNEDGRVLELLDVYSDGHYLSTGEESIFDLIEVKPRIKQEHWANVYPAHLTLWKSKEMADSEFGSHRRRIACTKIVIDVEEGEGLESPKTNKETL
jgi:hypothetical protein